MGMIVRNPCIDDIGIGLDSMCQVVLFNDNANSFDHVINSLITIFGHPASLAEKLANEAHSSGRTVAEVEEYQNAILHKGMLASAGLTAEVERI